MPPGFSRPRPSRLPRRFVTVSTQYGFPMLSSGSMKRVPVHPRRALRHFVVFARQVFGAWTIPKTGRKQVEIEPCARPKSLCTSDE